MSVTIGEHEFECGAARDVVVVVANTSTIATPRAGKVVVTTGALQPLEVNVTDAQGAQLLTKSLKPKSFFLNALAAQLYVPGSASGAPSDHGLRRVAFSGSCGTAKGGLSADILGGTQAQAFSLTLKANGVEATATGTAAAGVSTPAQFTAQVPVNCAQGPGAFTYKLTTGRAAQGTVTTGTVQYSLTP